MMSKAVILCWTFVAAASLEGCSNGGSSALGANASVPQTCQSCLAQSSRNECSGLSNVCVNDSNCAALNACVNNCANVNAGCVSNCAAAYSQNTINQWNSWAQCTCASC